MECKILIINNDELHTVIYRSLLARIAHLSPLIAHYWSLLMAKNAVWGVFWVEIGSLLMVKMLIDGEIWAEKQ
jgi:hypothetical protein